MYYYQTVTLAGEWITAIMNQIGCFTLKSDPKCLFSLILFLVGDQLGG